MIHGDPIETLAAAMHAACLRDLPVIEYQSADWEATRKEREKDPNTKPPTKAATRRPQPDDCRIIMFPEMWGSTALGYGGMGGAAMTEAYTVIVLHERKSAIYWGCGQLGYLVDTGCPLFREQLDKRNTYDRRDARLKGLSGLVFPDYYVKSWIEPEQKEAAKKAAAEAKAAKRKGKTP